MPVNVCACLLLLLPAVLPTHPMDPQSGVAPTASMPPPADMASIRPWFGGPPPTDPDIVEELRRRAEIVTSAIEMQDRSIRSMEWSQRCWGRRDGKPTRVLTEVDAMAFDEHGRWLFRGHHGHRQPGTDDLFMSSLWFAYDGALMRAFSTDTVPPQGNVRHHTEEFVAWLNLEHLLGRRMTLDQASLAEVIRTAPIIHDVTEDGDGRMTVVIEGRTWTPQFSWEVLMARVDINWPPRLLSITSFDPSTGRPMMVLRVDRFETHGGAAIPTGGERLLLIEVPVDTLPSESAARRGVLEHRMRDVLGGAPPPAEPLGRESAAAWATRTAMARALTREIMGPGGVPFSLHDADARYVEVTAIRSVNQPIPPERFEIDFPPGTRVGHQILGIVYIVGGPDDPAAKHEHADEGTP